jgi:7-keto-8-aminopelargonate synthetase-like enzyme
MAVQQELSALRASASKAHGSIDGAAAQESAAGAHFLERAAPLVAAAAASPSAARAGLAAAAAGSDAAAEAGALVAEVLRAAQVSKVSGLGSGGVGGGALNPSTAPWSCER